MTEGPYRDSAKPKTKTWRQEVNRVIYRWRTVADFEPLVIRCFKSPFPDFGYNQKVFELDDGRFLVTRAGHTPRAFSTFDDLESWLKIHTDVSDELYDRWGPPKEEVWL